MHTTFDVFRQHHLVIRSKHHYYACIYKYILKNLDSLLTLSLLTDTEVSIGLIVHLITYVWWLGTLWTHHCESICIKYFFQWGGKCSWQYAGQEVLICTYWGKNLIVQVILLPNLWMCSLASFIQNSIRNLIVSYSDTFKLLINVPRYTSSSLAFAMNATDHINVVFRKSAYSLMSRVTTSPTVLLLPLSIVMYISGLHWWISGRVCYMHNNHW